MTPEEALKINGLYEQIDALKQTNLELSSQTDIVNKLQIIEDKLDKLIAQGKQTK